MPIYLHSLAYQTDVWILGFEGRVEDRGDYIVAESADNPTYCWGNLLIMREAPQTGDMERWTRLFDEEFSGRTEVKHQTLAWDSPEGNEGDTAPFVAAGFEIQRSTVMTLRPDQLRKPRKWNPEVSIRPLESDADWEAAVQNQIHTRGAFDLDLYSDFKHRQMAKYRRITHAGLGSWFGAFVNGQLAGDCGLFIFNGIGRYQSVGTHPDFQRRGVCSTLIYEAADRALKSASKLVISAEPGYHAANIYESVGFLPVEKSVGMLRWQEKEEWLAP